jgi:hypothetical protein
MSRFVNQGGFFMPFELRGNCVHKTGDDAPIKCHETHEDAVKHLAALQANVPDATESIRRYQEAALTPTRDEPLTGKSWAVTIMGPTSPDDIVTIDDKKYLRSKNKRYYDLAGLEASVNSGLWQGIQVFDNHLTDAEWEQKQGMRSADSELLGAIVDPYWDSETSSIRGTHKIIKDDLSRKILNAHDAGILDIFGLSIDTKPIYGDDIQIGNEFFPVVAGIEKVTSIDLVSKPAAGGRFNHVLAAENNNQERNSREVEAMNEEEVKALVGQAIVDALNAKEEEKRIKAEEEEAERLKLEAEEAEKLKAKEEAEAESDDDGDDDKVPAQVEELETKFQALECRTMLRDSLLESKLSKAGQTIVRQAFSGRIFEAKELDAMIKTVKEAEAANDPSGRVSESGNQRGITSGQNEDDKLAIDFMRLMMGNNDFRALEHTEDETTIERLPEAFNTWKNTGKELTRLPKLSNWLYQALGGDPFIDDRAYEAVTTSSMSSIVKNTVNLMVANDYSKREKWWDPIVKTEEVDTIDDATLVRLYGLNTLDVVDEGGAYTELEWTDQEETSSFVKRGNYVGVTLEAMLKDKTNSIRSIPARLANSWFNSISLRVAAVFTNNSNTGPVLSDTGALFNATAVSTTGGHANLLTAALSFTAWDAVYTAMTKQTDQIEGAGAQLGMENAPKFCLVPTDLRATALQIRNSEMKPGTANNDINPYFQDFEVIVVPRWTDTNDWAAVADPNLSPALWLIFVRGNTVPSIFTADNESAGAMFTNDQLRWKVRQLTYRFSAIYDNVPVSDFRGLHKNNVA